jgi:hypothetical protein
MNNEIDYLDRFVIGPGNIRGNGFLITRHHLQMRQLNKNEKCFALSLH